MSSHSARGLVRSVSRRPIRIPRPLVLALLLAIPSWAQTFQSSLRGRVSDPNGGVTAEARLTLVDHGTNVARSTVSNNDGEYVFSSISPSTYTLTVEAPGFKRLERTNLIIATQAAVTLDVRLELGQVSEQINVTEDAPALQTADASTGQVIDGQKITTLPILGRNPFYMGKLAQSVVFVGNPKFARMQDQNANSQVSIAGGPLRSNNYLVDGISITDSTNRAVILPSPEAVQELKLQVSTYDAEAGRTGGGAFNTLLRSGTNELHGSAVGHFRETAWLANNFFANRAGQGIADQPFRDWAASLGGPVYLPKLYDGRNRTFFFATTEAYRQRDGSTTALSVPTALERQGNFSQSFARSGALQTIYDPFNTTPAGTRSPFPGNIIPASQLNRVGQALVSYYPLPNAPTAYYGAPNYNVTGSYPNRGDQTTWKADHQAASWLRASGSYIHQKTFEINAPNLFGNAGSPNQGYCCDRKIDATQANATITPNATTAIAIRWGFNRFYSRSTQASAGFDLASLGLPQSLVAVTPNPAFPSITMSDVSSFGGGGASQDVFYSRSFNTTVSKLWGRHSVKGGFEFRSINDIGTPTAGPTSLSFSDVFTRPNASASTAGQGSSLAALLLGYPTSGSMNVVTRFNDYVRYTGGFIHDDFRVSSKLTLNFGLRLEHESGVREVDNKLITGFDPTAANPLQAAAPSGVRVAGSVLYAGVNGNPEQTGNPKSIKLAPRFGFGYSLNPKTVLRGGYGIFWAPGYFTFQNAIGYSQTTSIIASNDGNATPAATLSNPYPSGLLQPTGNSLGALSGVGQPVTLFDPKAASAGYVQQYSLEVQRQVPAGFVVTVGALGSRGVHLLRSGQNVNQLNPAYFGLGSALNQRVANPFYNQGGTGTIGSAQISRSQLLLPFPQYSSLTLSNSATAASRYYSLYLRAERRLAQGLSVLASYTWSKSMDDVTGYSLAGVNQLSSSAGPQNAYQPGAEWSLSAQDAPNRFTTALTYDLPLGRNRRFLRNRRTLDWIAGGWSVNAIAIVQSGYPLSVTQPNNNSVIGASVQRPNATGIAAASSGSTTERIDGWFNSAAFTQAGQFTFGNTSRFINVRGPGTRNLDLSVFKTFSFRERLHAQVRAEALNATNTVLFGAPNTTFTNSQFGLITSQVNNPRLIQLGARVTF